MKIKRIILVMALLASGGILLSWGLMQQTAWDPGVDIVAVNETVKEVERQWDDLGQADFSGQRLDFAVISLDEQLLYSSKEGIFSSVHDAIRNRDTLVDIRQGGELSGKVIIPNEGGAAAEKAAGDLFAIIVVIYILLVLLCTLYLLYLNRTVIRPFSKLQHFAGRVARGHLDVPLNMERNNWFGAFSESFDLMREELAAARQSEYEANRSKKELVASLSHDIKTPLSSIKAVSELMMALNRDEKQQKQLRTIHNKAEQIDLLVTDMFHATLEELEELQVNVTETYSSVLADIIQHVNHYDNIICAPVPEVMVLADVRRLQQVFDNVISNANKYAGTLVHIDFQIRDQALEVSISDSGKGIPEEELPLIWGKFRRGSNAEGQSGSGLGLYISKYLMEQMHGDISGCNREDGFTVTLKIRLA